MKNHFYLFIFSLILFSCKNSQQHEQQIETEQTSHSDWFSNQRIFPYTKPDYAAYKNSLQWMNNQRSAMRTSSQQPWQYAGPENLGGRVVDVEMIPNDFFTMYACAASGGIFKSNTGGNSWFPIFDSNPSLSIGDLAIAPSNPDILYCGTGEANAGGGSLCYDGAGIFKSIDAGANWNYVGLDVTRNTGRIAVDPKNPDRVFAATMGDLFGNTPDRGLYRTTDGGLNWQNVLSSDDSTGAIDVVIHPQHTDTVYATLWTRVRRPDRRQYGGAASGIYRSYDGGNTWTKLSNGLPSYSLGRIGIDISQSSPNILYAAVEDSSGGNTRILKTTDFGDTWNDVTNGFSPSAYSYWYGRIKIDPTNSDVVYAIDFDIWQTLDGGQNWIPISNGVHVDMHEIYIHPQNPNLLLLANDGGFHVSYDQGASWTHNDKLPIMQFYTCEIDEQNPSVIYGGAQDNGVNTTATGATNDWYSIWGGDGFGVLVDPTNSSFVIAESQYAGISTGLNGVDPTDRINWNAPFMFNPNNSQTVYLGTEALYKSTDQGMNWYPLSSDLTNGSLAAAYPIVFATITTIAVAPSDTNIIYIGTDDGNIQVTTDEGANWNLISSSLPVRWITHLEVDPRDAMSVYATLSGYRYHENMSHVYHSSDGGNNWTDIGGNLPDVPCNDIVIDTTYSTLYIATDIGVFYSYLGSNAWQPMGTDLPLVPVCDLRLHYPTHKLLAATYGRSMYTYDLNILTAAASPKTQSSFSVFVLQNPIHDVLSLKIYSEKSASASVAFFNMEGKKILSDEELNLHAGNNFTQLNLLMGNISAGSYFVKISCGEKSIVRKICLEKS
ncbi:MAG: T9SS type A sorting domain-containing protein [Bacteroidetes bacterium]|nr:T9SS type A sorting domain-containing protein [Bacteroidota bacterium]